MISDSIGEIHISVIDGEAEEWHEIVRWLWPPSQPLIRSLIGLGLQTASPRNAALRFHSGNQAPRQ
jgi:hypothetical protein